MSLSLRDTLLLKRTTHKSNRKSLFFLSDLLEYGLLFSNNCTASVELISNNIQTQFLSHTHTHTHTQWRWNGWSIDMFMSLSLSISLTTSVEHCSINKPHTEGSSSFKPQLKPLIINISQLVIIIHHKPRSMQSLESCGVLSRLCWEASGWSAASSGVAKWIALS